MAKSDSVTAKLVRERYDAGLKPIRSDLQEYWLNHAFLHGHQWLWYNPQTRRLDDLPRDPDRVQATINRIWPNSRIIVSKALQRELSFEVIPTAADDLSIRGAKLAESVIEATRRDHDWEEKREQLTWAIWKGGTAAICVDWDPEGGAPVLPAETPEDAPVQGGDTIETVLSVADFVCEPGVRNGEKGRWWIKASVLPPEQVQAMFGLKKTPEADATAGTTPFQRKMLSTHFAGGDSEMLADLTLVLTYYERPNPMRPDGAMAIWVGGELVAEGAKPWPFPFKDHLNLAIAKETPIETKWTGETVLSMARPVQVAFNSSWSSIIEHMKQAGNARLFVPQSTIDLIESMTDMPGELVPYPDGSSKPEWGTPPQMPQWWVEEPAALSAQLDDIMGTHDISRGQAPTNAPDSGYGLSILAEQDTTPVGKLVKGTALAWGKVASMGLELFQQEVVGPREARVQTPSQPTETIQWTGEDLARQTNAIVPLEAVLPRSRAAMHAQAEKLVEMGLITTFEQFATVAELPGTSDLINRMSPDVAKARWENASMALGGTCVPDKFDDHHIHIKELNDFRKSPKYRMLKPEQQQKYELHAQAHANFDAELMAEAQNKAAISPALSAAASPNGGPILPVSELPPGGGTPAGGVPLDQPMPADAAAIEAAGGPGGAPGAPPAQ